MEEQDLISEIATKLNWSVEKLKNEITITPEILNIFDSLELRWIELSSPEVLKALRPITHKKYDQVFEAADQWNSVCIDIHHKITFMFYWSDNMLCWER